MAKASNWEQIAGFAYSADLFRKAIYIREALRGKSQYCMHKDIVEDNKKRGNLRICSFIHL